MQTLKKKAGIQMAELPKDEHWQGSPFGID
jgi:hypothetical protein